MTHRNYVVTVQTPDRLITGRIVRRLKPNKYYSSKTLDRFNLKSFKCKSDKPRLVIRDICNNYSILEVSQSIINNSNILHGKPIFTA